MKRTISWICALTMLLSSFLCVSIPTFANDVGAASEYTYEITGTVNYSKKDLRHNNDTYRIEIWTDDPEKPIAKLIKTQDMVDEQGNPMVPNCGISFKWTIITQYNVRRLYVDIYYSNELKKEFVFDNPDASKSLGTVYLFEDTTPDPTPEPPQPTPDKHWDKLGNSWYFYNKKQMLKGWQKDGGVWYFLDRKDGHMLTGWLKDGGVWYYLSYSGSMQTGWQKIGGVWYYFNASGAMVTGWQKINYKWYFFNSSGSMRTGWLYSGGKWYFLQSSGEMKCGWLHTGGKWYFMRNDGSMVANAYVVTGNRRYYVNASGVCTNM